jgi:hypothetical protein
MSRTYGPPKKIEMFDLYKFKKDVLEEQNGLCAFSQEMASVGDGEVIYSRFSNRDIFVSNLGLRFLREIYGDDYINKLIVNSLDPDDEESHGNAD